MPCRARAKITCRAERVRYDIEFEKRGLWESNKGVLDSLVRVWVWVWVWVRVRA